jgi:hypothetical protein
MVNFIIAVISAALVVVPIRHAIPAQSRVALVWEECLLSIICAAVIGFGLWRTWRHPVAKWTWIFPSVSFALLFTMFSLPGSDVFLRIALGAGAGAAAGGAIQALVRRRRLRKLGFSPDDLKSKERFFKKLGEVCAARIPEKVSFNQATSHSWSNQSKYLQSSAALESLGFQKARTFIASPQKWVAEFWLGSRFGLFAKIIDSEQRHVYVEITVLNQDGVVTSFENTEECGLQHREPDGWVHCGLITPVQLLERALHERHPDDARQYDLADYVSVYEKSVNEHMAWRRSVGISLEEARIVFDRIKSKRSPEPLNLR